MSEQPRTLRVDRMARLADDVIEVLLADPAGGPLPPWEPGAHVVLRLADGLSRQYSLCGDPADRGTWTVAVHRAPGSRGGSRHVHDQLRVGSLLAVEGPVNNFPLEAADRYLLVAGGIGITPILAMARHLRQAGADFRLVYCGRTAAVMAYAGEVSGWDDGRVTLHADDEQGGPLDLGALLAGHPGSLVYCCGPDGMLGAVERLAPDPARVRIERFRAAPVADTAADDAFDVVLARSGGRVRVEPGESILDVLERAGHDVPSSCREGICGTCETKLLRGEPDHRDSVLTPLERAENGSMMICVSRAAGPELELDL
jgi:tetrachlorobenzoquinone reductase